MSKISYNKKELEELLKHFHELTGIMISLYDNENHLIFSYPEDVCAFCSQIQRMPGGIKKCLDSDRSSFKAARLSRQCEIYTCHAGLVEATAPICDDGIINCKFV